MARWERQQELQQKHSWQQQQRQRQQLQLQQRSHMATMVILLEQVWGRHLLVLHQVFLMVACLLCHIFIVLEALLGIMADCSLLLQQAQAEAGSQQQMEEQMQQQAVEVEVLLLLLLLVQVSL
jgi:1,4-dihydroxy-2-naphthoate octaprenyltransferase